MVNNAVWFNAQAFKFLNVNLSILPRLHLTGATLNPVELQPDNTSLIPSSSL